MAEKKKPVEPASQQQPTSDAAALTQTSPDTVKVKKQEKPAAIKIEVKLEQSKRIKAEPKAEIPPEKKRSAARQEDPLMEREIAARIAKGIC